MNVEAELSALLEESGAVRTGHFQLSSGRHAERYVQCARLLERPRRARRVGGWLAERLRPFALDAIVAPALGGLIIGHEVAAALDLPFRFVERQDGTFLLRRGFHIRPDERIAVVEDVITTGGSSGEARDVVIAAGAEVPVVGAILDRDPGADRGFPVTSLLALPVPSWEAADCPLCATGSRPEKPGSRT